MTVRDESIHDDGRPCVYVTGTCYVCGATEPSKHEVNCLMCAVRALTEGVPRIWTPETAGESVSGTVLKHGNVLSDFGSVPFIDMWLGGRERIRIMAFGMDLRRVIESAAPQIGDTLSLWFDGEKIIKSGKFAGKTLKTYSANVQRGHGPC